MIDARPDLICFSHLRWQFVLQRPQHLMMRFAADWRVLFIEEPVFDAAAPQLEIRLDDGVEVVVPHLAAGLDADAATRATQRLLGDLFTSRRIAAPLLWFYTPMALPLAEGLEPSAVIYDCMDELSGFAGAPADLGQRERELLRRADVVFTGGHSLYEAKRSLHANVHAMPSSVDAAHFRKARTWAVPPEDQRLIPQPRIGFCGVIDERLDRDLVAGVAALRPDWHLVMIGPVVKIDPAALPRAANIHYLGMKRYEQLPAYFSGWDVAMLPFAHNDATRFISPTKTPEYLAAGLPVVSTSIRDVVRPYAEWGLVRIADTPATFVTAIQAALGPERRGIAALADRHLAAMSWDRTHAAMAALIAEAAAKPASAPPRSAAVAMPTPI